MKTDLNGDMIIEKESLILTNEDLAINIPREVLRIDSIKSLANYLNNPKIKVDAQVTCTALLG